MPNHAAAGVDEGADGAVQRQLAMLRRVLADRHADLRIRDVHLAAAGLMCWVFLGESPDAGEVAIRVPRHLWVPGDHGSAFPGSDLLSQEAVMSTHMRAHGVPAPEVIRLSVNDDIALLVTSYLRHDGGTLSDRELGRLTARLHGLPALDIKPAEQADLSADEVVIRRLVRRAGSIERLGGVAFTMEPQQLWSRLDDWRPSRAILHLDLRDVNLLCRQGRLVGLIDWGNLLFGDPALEFARLAEFGSGTSEFAAGYAEISPLPEVPESVEALYRLDTAVMLAAVHLEYGLDPVAGRRYLLRALQARRQLLG